jgi:hypothetical protein
MIVSAELKSTRKEAVVANYAAMFHALLRSNLIFSLHLHLSTTIRKPTEHR